MERKMSIHWPGLSLLCVAFLLCSANGAFGSIHPGSVKKIVDYITKYGIKTHYAVAVRLDKKDCQNPTQANLKKALPESEMKQMHDAIKVRNGIYVPHPIKNIVAARPNFSAHSIEHAEWRLLSQGKKSPTARMLLNKKEKQSCLIFFSKLSPCTERCLNEEDMRNIVQWLNPLFKKLSKDSKAFVFQTFYGKDSEKQNAVVVQAWKKIKNAPLFRCAENKMCIKCFGKKDKNGRKCLAKQR